MTRILLAGGASALVVGIGLLIPAVVEWLERAVISYLWVVVVSLAGGLVVCGIVAIILGFRRWSGISMPAPVRAAVTANILFLAFCAMETSDRLLRQQGRIFYWTSFLFMPVLVLLGGLILAQRWAWWSARAMTAILVLWLVIIMALIPFGDIANNSGPITLWGRIYMESLTLVFASISAYAFYTLGRAETRAYFRISRGPEPCVPPDCSGIVENPG